MYISSLSYSHTPGTVFKQSILWVCQPLLHFSHYGKRQSERWVHLSSDQKVFVNFPQMLRTEGPQAETLLDFTQERKLYTIDINLRPKTVTLPSNKWFRVGGGSSEAAVWDLRRGWYAERARVSPSNPIKLPERLHKSFLYMQAIKFDLATTLKAVYV